MDRQRERRLVEKEDYPARAGLKLASAVRSIFAELVVYSGFVSKAGRLNGRWPLDSAIAVTLSGAK